MNVITNYRSVAIETPSCMGRVAVLYGGTTSEREISLESGQSVVKALQEKQVDCVGVDLTDDWLAQLADLAFDRAFVVLIGGDGEGGGIQALLEYLHKPYVGSQPTAAMLAMNKYLSKQVIRHHGLLTPAVMLATADNCDDVVAHLGYPLVIKPNAQGSTVGISRVDNEKAYHAAVAQARHFGECVLAERWIEGVEYAVPIVAGQAMPSIRIEPEHGIYDYAAKYLSDKTGFFCPSGLDATEERMIQALALDVNQAIGCRDWARVDFIRTSAGDYYVLEINTVPGLTAHSLLPRSAKAIGMSFSDLVYEILSSAWLNTNQTCKSLDTVSL